MGLIALICISLGIILLLFGSTMMTLFIGSEIVTKKEVRFLGLKHPHTILPISMVAGFGLILIGGIAVVR